MTRSILLVEDNAGDVRLTREALREAEVDIELVAVPDGEQALAFLRDNDERPDLILLDLNLPRVDGREVLTAVKGDPALRDIPVIILTTSSAPPDVAFAYGQGANAYIRKPIGLDPLIDAAVAIRDFWLRTAALPSSA